MAIVAKKIQSAKLEAIAATKAVFKDYKGFIFADYRGLTVENITDLRRKLNEKNAKLKVVKNTYARVVFDEMKIENVAGYLTGPTAIALRRQRSCKDSVRFCERRSRVAGKRGLYRDRSLRCGKDRSLFKTARQKAAFGYDCFDDQRARAKTGGNLACVCGKKASRGKSRRVGT